MIGELFGVAVGVRFEGLISNQITARERPQSASRGFQATDSAYINASVA